MSSEEKGSEEVQHKPAVRSHHKQHSEHKLTDNGVIPAPIPFQKLKDEIKRTDELSDNDVGSWEDQLAIAEQLAESDDLYKPGKVGQDKNRYINIFPSKEHRVQLEHTGESDSDYVNACFMKVELPGSKFTYIGAQAPIPQAFRDFWRMIWEQKVMLVLMLTREKEKNKVKADAYWPHETNKPRVFGEISVSLSDQDEKMDGLKIRTFTVTKGKESRRVKHLQFVSWPDHGVPKDFKEFDQLFQVYREHRDKPNMKSPILVHCSAGIGRTGTFVLMDSFVDFLACGEVKPEDKKLDVFGALVSIRKQRPGAVQTKHQYVFIFKFLEYVIANQLHGVKTG